MKTLVQKWMMMLFLAGLAANGWADGYTSTLNNSYVPELTFTVQHALGDVAYTSADGGTINVAVAEDFDYTDTLQAVLAAKSGYEAVDSFPRYFLAQGTMVSMKHLETEAIKSYKVNVRRAKRVSLPSGPIVFGTANPITAYHPDSVKSQGWATATVAVSSNTPQLTAANHMIFFAYDHLPGKSALFKCQMYASNNNEQSNINVSISASADGAAWTEVQRYNSVPPQSASGEERYITPVTLSPGYRYVRLMAHARPTPNVAINAFSIVDDDTPTGLDTIPSSSGIFLSPDNVLKLGDREVVDVAVYGISGRTVSTCRNPSQDISLSGISKGIYLVRAVLADGSVITEKIIVR
jgi:hypothetical protein